MWNSYNANPKNNRVGDCTVRAISTILRHDWYHTYIGLCLKGFEMADVISADVVWGAYLMDHGFRRNILPCSNGLCTTVREFCEHNPTGEFIVCPKNHVVAVIDGQYFDTWDSGDEVVLYYWVKED